MEAASTRTFDITAPLPIGTTLLEASAGTGKTWTIAALVTRYVAEGEAALDELLVVTFGRAASQELRDRVRGQLVRAEETLSAALDLLATGDAGAVAALAQQPDGTTDPLLALLLSPPDPAPGAEGLRRDLAERAARLRTALSSFDAATIATIHQFSHQVLRSLGVAGDSDPSATLVEDLDDLLTEVVDDLYLQAWSHAQSPPITRREAGQLARDAVVDLHAQLVPYLTLPSPDGSPGENAGPAAGLDDGGPLEVDQDNALWQVKVRFAHRVRAELDRRKQRLGLLSYDDLLTQLASALADPQAPARRIMTERWKVVLIDEFQDTDPVQWQIFHRAFGGVRTMVLIGDPKQAIYAFRGGDIFTYLAAAGTATTQTLGTNYRSDQALVERLGVLLEGAQLGSPQITVGPVRAHHRGTRLVGAGDPLRLRVAEREHLDKRGRVFVADYRAHVQADAARDIKRLLTSGAQFSGRDLEPHDIAVLAQTNAQLHGMREALAAEGVPAVVAGNESVFRTQAAQEWLVLLEALEQPHRADRVRSAGLSVFLGHHALDLDQGGERLTERLSDTVREWSELLERRGISAVLEAASTGGLMARLLGQVGGERLLTDVRHIGQVLHQVERDEHLGAVALANWLRTQTAEGGVETMTERTRRLDSDAAAVQLLTVHRSKGLEFPVVYLPSAWDRFPREPAVPSFHDTSVLDPGNSEVNARRRNVGGPGSPAWQVDVAEHLSEEAGETLRLLYVALTRAQSQVVAWHAVTAKNTATSPLHRMLFGRQPRTPEVPDAAELYPPDRTREILGHWSRAGGPQPEPAILGSDDSGPLPTPQDQLGVRTFTRTVDTDWRRTSYSSLSSVIDHAPSLSEPEEPPLSDEPAPDVLDPAAEPDAVASGVGADVVSPMGGLPVGATFGSLVHAVLEHADPAAPRFDGDFAAELRHHVAEQLPWWPVDLDPEELTQALVTVCQSPLGPLAGDRSLMDFGLGDRLRELDFELPLAGGDEIGGPHGHVTLGDLAPILIAHLPEGDPVRGYVEQLAEPALADQRLLGYLTGSIDVVLRLPAPQADGPAGAQRYLTVDYKTNWLGGMDRELTAAPYRPEALDAAMAHSDYPLQALLYTVVLHRYLRWRLPDYDPEVHLGGVLYLYLRGMCGPETPRVDGAPCGVFAWRPPVPLVHAVSDLLDGRVTTPGGGAR